MKGKSGIQTQGLEIFSSLLKKIKNDRVLSGIDIKPISDKLLLRLIARYFKHYKQEYRTLVNADIILSEGQDLKKVQIQGHNEYINFKKVLKNDRIAKRKEGNGELSDWRLSLTLTKFFEDPARYDVLVKTKVNANDD